MEEKLKEAVDDVIEKADTLLKREARCHNGEHHVRHDDGIEIRHIACVCFEMDALKVSIAKLNAVLEEKA